MTYSQQESVEIPGAESNESKLAIAEALGNELWAGPLKPYILKSVPELTESDLRGLGLRWGILAITNSSTGNSSSVRITCVYTANERNDRMSKIVAACKQLVNEYVVKRVA
jgi:hypothetical protein